jgi:thiol-disulfide isomerase/thioredoxin
MPTLKPVWFAAALLAGVVAGCVVAGCVVAGCDESKPAPPPARVVAVAAQRAEANEREFCDVRFEPGKGPAFVLPAVEGEAADKQKAGAAGRARWVNVWATWCPPCTEELPLLTRLSASFEREGVAASLVLISVDSGEDAVAKFGREHPEALHSLRVSEASALEPWLKSLGLGAGATLPVHVFVDPHGRITCARTGAVRESDAASIRQLLKS